MKHHMYLILLQYIEINLAIARELQVNFLIIIII